MLAARVYLVTGLAAAQTFKQCIKTAYGGNSAQYAFPNDIEDLLYGITDVRPYNLDHPYVPAAVVIREQARKCQKPFCLGGTDGALVINLKSLDGFSYNASDGTAKFGPGNRLGPVTDKLEAVSRTMAYGVNADVGAGGHITIGGLGTMSRQLGLGLDQIQSVECVLANGTIVTTSKDQNSDLFWAVRGAGASFAIVTSYTAQTVAVPEVLALTFNITAAKIPDLAPTWKAWQDHVAQPDLTRLFGCTLTLTGLGSGGLLIFQGTYYGSQAEFNQLNLAALLPEASPGISITGEILPTTANALLQLTMDLFGGVRTHFYAKSIKYTNETLLTLEQAQSMFSWLEQTPKGTLAWFIIWDLNGGAISDPAREATAYWHRDALFFHQSYVIDFFTVTDVNDVSRDFLNGFNIKVRSLRAGFDESAYAGYVDYNLTDPQTAYWGGNVQRLKQTKKEIDPSERFWNPQSITPA